MKSIPKLLIALGATLLLTTQSFSQSQSIPVPASSINGGRGVVAIVIPTLPSDLCTSSNGYCVTGSNVAGYVNPIVSTAIAANGVKPWTSYFIGQQRCGGGVCAVVQGDGLLRWTSIKTGMATSRVPNMNEAFGVAGSCQGMIGAGFSETWSIYPTGTSLYNSTPTDWVVEFSQVVCNPSGGGGNAN